MNKKLPIGTQITSKFRLGDKVVISNYMNNFYIGTIIGCNMVEKYENRDPEYIAVDIEIPETSTKIVEGNIADYIKDNIIYTDSNVEKYTWVKTCYVKRLTKAIILDYTSLKDECIAKIVYQDYNILPRGEFEDKELNIRSLTLPQYITSEKIIFLQGTDKTLDHVLIRIPKEDIEEFKNRINKLNEKYVTDINKLVIDTKTVTIKKMDYPNKILLEDYEIYKIKKRLDKIETILNIEEE